MVSGQYRSGACSVAEQRFDIRPLNLCSGCLLRQSSASKLRAVIGQGIVRQSISE
jgi:hypothetical protein